MAQLSRRQFLKYSAGSAAAAAMMAYSQRWAWAFYQTPGGMVKKFAQPLRGVGPGGIPVALPDISPAPVTRATHYSINIGQYTDQLHPSLGPTTLWGYSPARALGEGPYPKRHLGGIIVAQKGVPIQLTFTNRLPPTHPLPVDISSNFPDAANRFGGNGYNAACTHLHGGFVPWTSDGGPMAWFTPNGNYGPSAMGGSIYRMLNPKLQPGQAEIYYPNQQSARMMWYHDHAHDITRLNAYAGIATAYIIRDTFEGNLRNLGLPDFVENGGREIPLVIQDKIFVGSDIAASDPAWTGPRGVGSLWYPHTYEKSRWKYTPASATMPEPSCIPEMFGDTMLANGTVYPAAQVEARRYRLRILNACQARFLNLQLYVDDGSPDSITLNPKTLTPTNPKGPDFLVIGTEGGFLPKPVLVPSNQPLAITSEDQIGSLITAPAERWDVLVDFSGYAGKRVILYNDASAPFEMGDSENDYYWGCPGKADCLPGYAPDTRQIMCFDVVPATSADPPLSITPRTSLTAGLDPFIVPPGVAVQNGVLNLPAGIPVRQLTLNEVFDSYGRLIQMLGANSPTADGYGEAYMDEATETPSAGATEVWQIANFTGDVHPIHFHLVNVQILGRQPFDTKKYDGEPVYTGPARGPLPTELGWKETVKMNPEEVTTVIMRFDLPQVPFRVPSSPMGGHEYVWHCHILEHEEHDMMRPLIVT